MIDLHIHTNASDGIFSLEEIVKQAERAGLKAIAITDHDTIQSSRSINEFRARTEVELVPGTELSIYDDGLDYIDVHVLGLFIDTGNSRLISKIRQIDEERENQKKGIIKNLNKLGYEITYEEARKKAKGSFGRPHIARVLVEKYPKEFQSISDVFDKLLDNGKSAFLGRTASFGLGEAIELVHSSRGLAILAHPKVYSYNLEKLLDDFRKLGGDGIETFYDYARNYARKGYTDADNSKITKELRKKAKETGFLESGGSDFHGPNKGAPLGSIPIPDILLEKMKAYMK